MRLEEREMDICEYLEHPVENALYCVPNGGFVFIRRSATQ